MQYECHICIFNYLLLLLLLLLLLVFIIIGKIFQLTKKILTRLIIISNKAKEVSLKAQSSM